MSRVGSRRALTRVRSFRSSVLASAAIVGITASVVLTGCAPQQRVVSSSPPVPTPSASSVPSGSSSTRLVPDGTASDNFAYFRRTGHRLLDHNQGLKGRAIIDGFVRAGFEKKNMELTPDKTSIGLDAWNIEWSVKFGKTCIVGQAGNTRFQSFTGPVLSTGKCLFGTTRPITW